MAGAGRILRQICRTNIAGPGYHSLLLPGYANPLTQQMSSQAGSTADLQGTFTERLGCPVGSTLTLISSAGQTRVMAESPHDAPESILLRVTPWLHKMSLMLRSWQFIVVDAPVGLYPFFLLRPSELHSNRVVAVDN
jgi:hypothetical protein